MEDHDRTRDDTHRRPRSRRPAARRPPAGKQAHRITSCVDAHPRHLGPSTQRHACGAIALDRDPAAWRWRHGMSPGARRMELVGGPPFAPARADDTRLTNHSQARCTASISCPRASSSPIIAAAQWHSPRRLPCCCSTPQPRPAAERCPRLQASQWWPLGCGRASGGSLPLRCMEGLTSVRPSRPLPLLRTG